MVDLVVTPVNFAPTKVGYRHYLKAGGSLKFEYFKTFERRSEVQILLDKADRLYNACQYHNEQDLFYKSINDSEGRKIHLASYEIRSYQYIEVCRELKKLGVIHE